MSNYYDFNAIQNYTIGAGAIRELRRLTQGWGKRYLIMNDGRETDWPILQQISDSLTHPVSEFLSETDNKIGRGAGLLDSLPKPDLNSVKLEFEFYTVPGKICSCGNAEEAGKKIAEYDPDVVVAVGGGKCLDMTRAALHYTDVYRRPKLVMCPTVLSSNACATGMAVIYDEKTKQMADFWNLAYMPEYVIVDTEIIVNSPAETLAAGIGDQLASSIEAIHTLEKTGESAVCDRLCLAHHRDVINILRRYAVPAIEAVRQKKITHEFEWVCHCITRYTGPQMASATSFFAHILDEALIELEPVSRKMHGYLVGYGILPEMVIFGTPEKIPEYVKLFRQIGLPVNLAELGLTDCTYEDILEACRNASDKIMASRSVVRWTPEEMAEAVMEAEKIVRSM